MRVDTTTSGAGGQPSTGEVAVLVNPIAGRRRHGDLIEAVLARLRAGRHPVRVLAAADAAQARAACAQAVRAGAAALVTVGGDGTSHLGLQAVAGTSVPLGIVPAGTGNDFAVEVGVPEHPLAAAGAVVQALAGGRTRRVDLARLRGPDGQLVWYGAVLGAGFDSIVNERANAMRWPRGPRRYDLAIFAELLRLRPRRYQLTLDGEVMQVDAVLVAVGNTASYGGGMRICAGADPTDGKLDVVVAGALSRATLVRIKPRVYKGTHLRHPMVRHFRAGTVGLGGENLTVYADGERICPLPIEISAVPGALNLLV